MWFLWLNWRKSTFYPFTAPNDSKCWPIVTSSIQEPTASNCDVTMTDCSCVVAMDAFLAQWNRKFITAQWSTENTSCFDFFVYFFFILCPPPTPTPPTPPPPTPHPTPHHPPPPTPTTPTHHHPPPPPTTPPPPPPPPTPPPPPPPPTGHRWYMLLGLSELIARVLDKVHNGKWLIRIFPDQACDHCPFPTPLVWDKEAMRTQVAL